MPRTKVSRNAKRNRDAAKDEALLNQMRNFDLFVDQWLSGYDLKCQHRIDQYNNAMAKIRGGISQRILGMKMGEIWSLNASTIDDLEASLETQVDKNRSLMNMSLLKSAKKKSKEDEGYLTEDSGRTSNIATASGYSAFTRNAGLASARAAGPLSSAKAKARTRRSRSACGYLSTFSSASSIQSTVSTAAISASTSAGGTTGTDRMSRSKMRTPLTRRSKAMSADRATPVTPKICPNTPLSILRYPRFGETVISLSGSPVVAQSIAESIANVNIPIKDGVLSLRPTRMEAIDPDLIHRIDFKTLHDMKQLQSNLNAIMSIADKALGNSK